MSTQLTSELIVSWLLAVSFTELISLAAFLPSDSVMGGERSGEAEDHELSFSQEWQGERKRRMEEDFFFKKGKRRRRERRIEIFCAFV